MSDAEAQLQVYVAHRASLVDYARAITGSRAQAEDAVQDAWLRFSRSMAAGGVRDPVQYLFRIVRNLALDRRRRLLRDRSRFDTDLAQAETLADERPTQEAAILARSELDLVLKAMAELPPRTRTALEMHRFAGKTLTEIATHLGVSVGTAHALVAEGIKHCHRRRLDAR